MAAKAPAPEAIELSQAVPPLGAMAARGWRLLLLRSTLTTQMLFARQRERPGRVSMHCQLAKLVQLRAAI